MKVSCLQENLAEGLAAVGRVVPAKSTLPVLSNVLLIAESGQLRLSATNLEMAVSTRVAARILEEGTITLPARLLSEYVGLLDKGSQVDMALNQKNRKVHLSCGRYEANIAGLDAEDFPAIPTVSGGAAFSLPGSLLKEVIEQVAFAAAQDDTRPVLAGVLFRLQGNRLTLAAADGFRLAVRSVELESPVGEDLAVIIPSKALSELARALPDGGEEMVEIAATANRNQILFRSGDTEIVSRLIEGQFPDYQRIIPQDARTRVILPNADFLRSTKVASVFARDNANIVKLQVKPSGESADEQTLAPGQITVISTSTEMGDNQGVLDASVSGEEQLVAFNGKYLRDALEAIDTPEIRLEITGPSSPGVLRPLGPTTDTYLHVIMPMHVAR